MAICAGVARKASIPFVVLAICGWIIFVVGFALFNNDNAGYQFLVDNAGFPEHRADIDLFPFWCFLITGPILFINLIVHLIVGRWFTGIFTNFLTALYLVMAGSVLYTNGLILFEDFDEASVKDKDLLLYTLVEWVGALISAVFVTIHMMSWPLFRDPKQDEV